MLKEDSVEIKNKTPGKRDVSLDIEELIADVARLEALLKMENEYLKKMQYEKIQALLDEKTTLVYRLEIKKKMIAHNRGVLKGKSPATETALKKIYASLEKVALENFREANALKEVNRRVVETIASAVERELQSARGYTKTGHIPAAEPKRKSTSSALTLNKTV